MSENTKPTVSEIVSNYLKENGFDGLCGDECGCPIEDLFLCSPYAGTNCVPGYKNPCDCGEGCEWHMNPTRPKV